MDMISKESAYKAIKNVCDKFNMAFGVSKWSKGSFSAEIATCLDELPVYDLDEIRGVIKDLVSGKWVECEKVQRALNLSFEECFSLFEFSRVASWWSVVGKTEEEKQRNGQKVDTYFRIRGVGKDGKE